MGTPYAVSSDLVSAWPAKSLAVATYLDSALAAKLGTLTVNAQTGTTYTLTTTDPQKVVTMTNAAASAVTVPTNAAQAVTIGSQTEIVNLSTGVACTVAPAGGVTLHGGSVVLSPGSSVTLAKIGTDTWMVQGQGAPGLTLLATATASAAATLSINNCFSTAYDIYEITFDLLGSSGGDVNARLRVGGVDASGANYNIQSFFASGPTLSGASTAGLTSGVMISMNTTRIAGGRATIYRPALAERTIWRNDHVQDTLIRTYSAYHTLLTAYDGFTLIPAAGTITGTVRVYGYRNA